MFHIFFLFLNRYIFVNIDLPHKSLRIYREIHYILQIYCKVLQCSWFCSITFICFGGIFGFFLLSFITRAKQEPHACYMFLVPLNHIPDSYSQFFYFIFYNFIRCMSILPICIYVFCMRSWCLGKSEEGFQSSETVVIAGSELQYWC